MVAPVLGENCHCTDRKSGLQGQKNGRRNHVTRLLPNIDFAPILMRLMMLDSRDIPKMQRSVQGDIQDRLAELSEAGQTS